MAFSGLYDSLSQAKITEKEDYVAPSGESWRNIMLHQVARVGGILCCVKWREVEEYYVVSSEEGQMKIMLCQVGRGGGRLCCVKWGELGEGYVLSIGERWR